MCIRDSLVKVYDRPADAVTAYEILKGKIEASQQEDHQEKLRKDSGNTSSRRKKEGVMEKLSKNTMIRQVGRTVAREIARGLLGALGVGTRRR